MKNIIILLVFFFGLITEIKSQNTIMNIHQTNGNVTQIPLNEIDSITYSFPQVADISTAALSGITGTSAICGGEVTNENFSSVTQKGICWSTSTLPTINDDFTNDGNGLGGFVSTMDNLLQNTTYYVRAYAINGVGVSYGNELVFTTGTWLNPNLNYGSVSDIDGNSYATIVIGAQEWMAENLRTTSYSNGDPIPNIQNEVEWFALDSGAWCHYNNDSQNEVPYGKLYNWYTVQDTRGVCPTNWHVPSEAEIYELYYYLDPNGDFGGNQPNSPGTLLKTDQATIYWSNEYPNPTALYNATGFSAIGSGARTSISNFFAQLNDFMMWSSTQNGVDSAGVLDLYYGSHGMIYIPDNSWSCYFQAGNAIRCLKD